MIAICMALQKIAGSSRTITIKPHVVSVKPKIYIDERFYQMFENVRLIFSVDSSIEIAQWKKALRL